MPKFEFTKLRELHKDMKEQNENRAVFPFEYNKKSFSCVFITDIKPYRLYLTAIGSSNLSFEILIDVNYEANTFIEGYNGLVSYLDLKYDPNHTFKPVDLFKVLNNKIPNRFSSKPSYKDVLRISAGRKIEEGNAVNFCGWRRSPTGRVSEENLEKTRKAFGDKYAKMSKSKGISSCWTIDDNKEELERLNELVSM